MPQNDTLKAVVIGVIVGVIGLAVLLVVSQSNTGSSVAPQEVVDLVQHQIDGTKSLLERHDQAAAASYSGSIKSITKPSKISVSDFNNRFANIGMSADEVWCYEYTDTFGGSIGYVTRTGNTYESYGPGALGRPGWEAAGC